MKLKEGKIKIDEFRRKLGFTEFDIMIHREYLFKSKMGKVFGNKKFFWIMWCQNLWNWSLYL